MKTKLIALIVCSLLTHFSFAKIWRVNNNASGTYGENLGGSLSFPVFKQLTNVNTANIVLPGDTIHLEGSNAVYDGVSLTKRMVIIGTGYLLTDNINTSSDRLQCEIKYVEFLSNSVSSSSGSQLIGVYVGESFGVKIAVSNILIKRCRLDFDIDLGYGISDITIVQNYFPDKTVTNNNIFSVSSFGFPSHVLINNNIIERTLVLPNNAANTVDECKNNVFANTAGVLTIQMYVGFFQNNILINQNATVIINGVSGPSSNPNISYNISALASSQFGTAFNNIEANMTNLFVNLASTSDAGYQLKPNSAGSNNASDGSDRGAFGGASAANRYTLCGLAPIPVIYEIMSIGVASPATGLPVTIKARTIK